MLKNEDSFSFVSHIIDFKKSINMGALKYEKNILFEAIS